MSVLEHDACGRSQGVTRCGECLGVWCDLCDPSHGPLCPWCAGRGYSTAALSAPLYRQANHARDNGGHPVQGGEAGSPARFLCKRCGAESPAGVGYVQTMPGVLPAPDPACPNPHVVDTERPSTAPASPSA